jgi:hypothetical protein
VSPKVRNKVFVVFAVLAAFAAIYHLAGIFSEIDESPPWRHALFVVITTFCVYGFLKRPYYFVYFIAVLLVQQFYSHGTYLINLWVEKGQLHWISVFDLLLLPIALFCLIDDCKMKKKKVIPM